MLIRRWLVGATLLVLVAISFISAEDIKLDGIYCVMNPKSEAKIMQSLDYKGGKIYFCCDKCPQKFDAEKHAVAANHQLIATKQAKQEKCPVSGQPIKAEHKVNVQGVEVAFCCPNCKAEVSQAEGEAQMKLVFNNEAFEKGFKVVGKKK